MEGWLSHKSALRKRWTRRHYELNPETGELAVAMIRTALPAVFVRRASVTDVSVDSDAATQITLTYGTGRSFWLRLRAGTVAERDAWMDGFARAQWPIGRRATRASAATKLLVDEIEAVRGDAHSKVRSLVEERDRLAAAVASAVSDRQRARFDAATEAQRVEKALATAEIGASSAQAARDEARARCATMAQTLTRCEDELLAVRAKLKEATDALAVGADNLTAAHALPSATTPRSDSPSVTQQELRRRIAAQHGPLASSPRALTPRRGSADSHGTSAPEVAGGDGGAGLSDDAASADPQEEGRARLQLKLVTHAFELDKMLAHEEREKEHGRQQERLRLRRQQLLDARASSRSPKQVDGTSGGLLRAASMPTMRAQPPPSQPSQRSSQTPPKKKPLPVLPPSADNPPASVASNPDALRLFTFMRDSGHPITPVKVKRLLKKFDGRTDELFERLELKFAAPKRAAAASPGVVARAGSSAAASAARAAAAASERAAVAARDEKFLTTEIKTFAAGLLTQSRKNVRQLGAIHRVYTGRVSQHRVGMDAAAARAFAREFNVVPDMVGEEEWEAHFVTAQRGEPCSAAVGVLTVSAFIALVARVALSAHPAGQSFNAVWQKDPLTKATAALLVNRFFRRLSMSTATRMLESGSALHAFDAVRNAE